MSFSHSPVKYCALLAAILMIFSSSIPAILPVLAEDLPDSESVVKPSSVDGEILIKYRDESVNLRTAQGQEISSDIMTDQWLVKKDDIDLSNIALAVVTDETRSTEDVIHELEKDPRIEFAQPNYQYYPTSLGTDDTYASLLWWLDDQNDADIDIPEAWSLSEGNSVIVAVIDSGVAYYHPDLAANMWDGTSCKSNTGADLGGCIHGYDFEDDDKNPLPSRSTHGTHIAGIIGAVKNNATGVAGVAPQVKIMAIKSSLTSSNIVQSINFARENGAKIINASWGSNDSSMATDNALISAIQNFPGIFVTAAGNDGSSNETNHFYPSDYTLNNIISVTATNDANEKASYWNYGITSVDLGAPGSSIYSTIPTVISLLDESFESQTVPNIPAGFFKTGDWWTITILGGGKAIASDTSAPPYRSNSNSMFTFPTYNLNNGGSLSFDIQCDTKYTNSAWEDYLVVESSYNGVTFTPIKDPLSSSQEWRIDEAYLDQLNWDNNSSGSSSYAYSGINIPASNQFTLRFRWVTNGSDNNYGGCTLDNIKIKKYSDGSDNSYSYSSGTSMAAPHVAGVAALLWWYNPNLTTEQVKNALLNTGDTLWSLVGKTVSGKKLNAYSALQSVSSEKTIMAFNFTNPAVTGIIDEAHHTVQLNVPATPVTSFTPTITIQGASISPASGVAQNFIANAPVNYTVTARDGTTQVYAVTVIPILDKTMLTSAITAEVGGNHTPGGYVHVLTEADYTAESWWNYTAAIAWAVAVETNPEAPIEQIITSIATINTTKNALVFANLANLNSILSTTQSLLQSDYTTESWTTLSTTLALPQGTNSLIVDKINAINSALSSLVFAGKADLDTAKNAVSAAQENTYTPTSWQTFITDRDAALALPETSNALVVTKRQAINNALLGLVTVVDNAALTAIVEQTNSLHQADYTVESWTMLSTALALPETSNALVVSKKSTITGAIEWLVRSILLNNTASQVSVAHSTNITIQDGTNNPALDVSGLVVAGTGVLPHINITADNANHTTISIPDWTTVSTPDITWNGIMTTPTTTSIVLPVTSGQTKTLSTAIQIGYAGAPLSFNKGVRILLVWQANKRAGYSHSGSDFTEITTTCWADDQSTGNLLPADWECKINIWSDLVIWTKHFTTFATFSSTANSGGWSWGGGGGGGIVSVTNTKVPTKTLLPLEPTKTELKENTKIFKSPTLEASITKALSDKKRIWFATRLETVLLSLNVRGTPIETKYTCQKFHTDTFGPKVPSFTCQVAEKAQMAGIISATNKQFKPLQSVSRIEAYSIMMKSICVHPVTNGTNWKQEVIKKAMELWFTVRNMNTFEPDKPLLVPEMYAVVKRLNDYANEHNTCSVE